MLTDEYEIKSLRATTQDLIEADHVSITLKRAEYERSPGAGVRKTGSTPKDPKDRFFGDVRGNPVQVRTDQGEELVASKVLIGPYDDDITEGDTFTIGNHEYLVAEVIPDRSYQCKAWVVDRRG